MLQLSFMVSLFSGLSHSETPGMMASDQTTTTSFSSTTKAGEESCPIGWIDNGDQGCFLFSSAMVGLSWVQALEYCEEQVRLPIVRVFIFLVSKDGFLAEPKTAEQFEFISSLAYLEESLSGVPAWWIGLADFGHEGEWVWQVGLPPPQ